MLPTHVQHTGGGMLWAVCLSSLSPVHTASVNGFKTECKSAWQSSMSKFGSTAASACCKWSWLKTTHMGHIELQLTACPVCTSPCLRLQQSLVKECELSLKLGILRIKKSVM